MKVLFSAIMFLFCLNLAYSDGYIRYPNADANNIVFTQAGDIYKCPLNGGLAVKLTSSVGAEEFPRLSPDGNWIAFTAQYDGNYDIYVMPLTGGTPIRLTYTPDLPDMKNRERMGPPKIIMHWTSDGKYILYRDRTNEWNSLAGKLYKISVDGGLPEEVEVPIAGFASISEDNSLMAYNRVYREYRTWKRYRGGQADEVWLYNFKTKEIENISENSAQDIIPMIVNNKVYYLSDRDHTLNIFSYDLNTKDTKKVTNFTDYDVKFPSMTKDYIAFEVGGDAYILNPTTDKYDKVNITINDEAIWARNEIKNVKKSISSFDISPKADYALFTSRGEMFTYDVSTKIISNLTKSSGVHDRDAVISPNGKDIAYISDESGETEVYIIKPDGSNKVQLTNNTKSYRYGLKWSPCGRYLLNSDKLNNLYLIDTESKKSEIIAHSKQFEFSEFSFSPDSKWVVFTDLINNQAPAVFLYSIVNKTITQVSDEYFESSSPIFSECGKYLFFVSKRTFDPEITEFEWNFFYSNMSKIYGYTLCDTIESPFAPQLASDIQEDISDNDEEAEPQKPVKKKGKKDKDIEKTLKIDLENIQSRLFELPVKNADYWGLKSIKDRLYYAKAGKSVKPGLYYFDFKAKEEKEVASIMNYEITPDGKKIIYQSKGEYYISDVREKMKLEDEPLDLSTMNIEIDKRAEWKQILNETYRQMRDFFYDPDMHGVDWKAMRDKYAALLPKINHRADLSYILGEMIGELNIGHAYTGGGDLPIINEKPIGLLGAKFELHSSGYYKIKSIYKGRNWEEKTRSPLTELAGKVKEGDYIISIDGNELSKENSPYKLLVNKAEQYVKILISSTPDKKNAKEYIVKTISSESGLIYYNWVEKNRQYVSDKTNGRVGYLHVPDMSPEGLTEFVKYFYPQVRKEALIIDDRGNGGGNVSPMLIERLRRILVVAKNARNQEMVFTNPSAVMTGPMVMLINQQSMSDGDLFPYQFHTLGLGKIIGKRSWGGVIGIRGSLPFIDGGYLNRPEFANFGADGTWILEGVGMTPDIEVDNHPAKEYNGIDEQLDKAIEEILKEIPQNTKPQIPKVPPYPNKSK